MNYIPGICNFCGTGCGHVLKIDDGRVTGVFPSGSHPISKNRLCVRGWNMHELLGTHQRIKQALVKEEDKLNPVAYDKAIKYVAEILSNYNKNNNEEIAFLASPRSSNEENYALMKFARTICKTNNISIESESGHRNSLNVLNIGTGIAGMTGSLSGIKNSDLILTVDYDVTHQNPIVGSEIHFAARSGAKLIVIDSRKTQIAKLSDGFINVNPGSTKILFAALSKILIEDKLIDSSYLEENTRGFEGFANILGSFSTSEIFGKTGIEIERIKNLAREIINASSVQVFFPSGVSGLEEDTISYIYNLMLITGKIGKKGCSINPITGISNLQGSYDMGCSPDILPGFKSIYDDSAFDSLKKVWNNSIPRKDGRSVSDLLMDESSPLEVLFVVNHDEGIFRYSSQLKKVKHIIYIGDFINPFIEFADVVLPLCSYIEKDGTYTNAERRVQLVTKKIDAKGDARPLWQIISSLSSNISKDPGFSSAEEIMKEISSMIPSYAKISYEKLKSSSGIQWPCNNDNPDGVGTLTFKNFQRPLNFTPVTDNFDVPLRDASYPFLLMIGKSQHFWHRNNLMRNTIIPLREFNATLLLYPEGYIELNPEDAKKLQVRDKWKVRVESKKGSMTVEVKISDEIKEGTAYVPYFVQQMISEFLLEQREKELICEDAAISVNIKKV